MDAADPPQVLVQIKADMLQLEPAMFHFRKIEDIVDDAQQILGTLTGAHEVLPLLLRELRMQRQLDHAIHTVDRRADLMTHIRQEFTLHAAHGLCALACILQGLLPFFPYGVIDEREDDLLFVLRRRLRNENLQPDRLAAHAAVHGGRKLARKVIIHHGGLDVAADGAQRAERAVTAAFFIAVFAAEGIAELLTVHLWIRRLHHLETGIVDVDDGAAFVEHAKSHLGRAEHGPHVDMIELDLHLELPHVRDIAENDGTADDLSLAAEDGRAGRGEENLLCPAQNTDVARQSHGMLLPHRPGERV